MSEDVKPRKFTLERYGHTYYGNKVTKAHYNSYLYVDETLCENGLPKRETIYVIELEPTMRMMDELANKLQILDDLIGDLSLSPNPESNTIRMEITYDILEKYKKFKEGLK